MRQTERCGRKRRVALGEFGINLAFDRNVDARLLETAAANIGDEREPRDAR